MGQSVNLSWKVVIQSASYVSPSFVADTKITFSHNFLALLSYIIHLIIFYVVSYMYGLHVYYFV